MDFTGMAVDDRDALAGIIDKELLPSAMALAHDQVELAGPGSIRLAEPAVLEALRCGGLVFLPQQEQGDTLPFELVVHRGPVGGHGCEEAFGWRGRKQEPFEGSLIESLRERPRQACGLRSLHIGRDGRTTQTEALGDLSITEAAGPFQTQDFVDLTHG